jgi:hypothetical protein
MKRRQVLKALAALPALGAGAALPPASPTPAVDGITGATVLFDPKQLDDLVGPVPKGRIGDFEVSRLILGGNLIGGWAHARDLLYVSQLSQAYNTDRKVHETLLLAEQCGINTINVTGSQLGAINWYRKLSGSSLQIICQVHPTRESPRRAIDHAISYGATMLQIQGNCCDWRVRDGEVDVIADAIDYIRAQGYLAGLGAHSVQALLGCEQAGIEPDFFMKTFHHDRYWSAHPREKRVPYSVDGNRSADHNEFHDNMFCLFAEETAAFMARQSQPFIAFKVLAAGAIPPHDGFRYAFENGADFVCVGMFDFQIVDDANIANGVLDSLATRQRPWCG